MAGKLTYHIDELRNKLTSFFLTFAGAGGVAITIMVRGEQVAFLSGNLLAAMLFVIAALGITIVAILARLRRAQIEHFRIINNIRAYFLEDNYGLWNVVQLSEKTLPEPNRRSGTYMWTLLITIVICFLASLSAYLAVGAYKVISHTYWPFGIAVSVFLVTLLCVDKMYLLFAEPPDVIVYSQHFPPHPVEAGLPADSTETQ